MVNIPITIIPGLPPVQIEETGVGFCGGMAFLTRDIWQAGTQQLRNTSSLRIPQRLALYLRVRLVQSFAGDGVAAQWLAATRLPDEDTILGVGMYHWSVLECPAIMANVDDGILCPIGIVLQQSPWPEDVFTGHCELVWGYELVGDMLTLHVYDCNRNSLTQPGMIDDRTITLDIADPDQLKAISTNGTDWPKDSGRIRGFFRVGYAFADPAPAYIEWAEVAVKGGPPPEMKPGDRAQIAISVHNRGSTAWRGSHAFRLGSLVPRDNTTWGVSRVDIPGPPLEPDDTATVKFQITAPQTSGRYAFSWGVVHEGVGWIGAGTTVQTVAVGLPPQHAVPDVTGWRRDEALAEIAGAGLVASVSGSNTGNSYVADQRPDPGTLVNPGSEVRVHLQKGSPPLRRHVYSGD